MKVRNQVKCIICALPSYLVNRLFVEDQKKKIEESRRLKSYVV